jgi:hypothetical protein
MKTTRFFLLALALLTFCAPASTHGAEGEQKKDRQLTLEVVGQISSINSRTISVEFSRSKTSAEEVLIPLTSETVLQSPLRSLSQLQRGDTVKVRYIKVVRDNPDGQLVVRSAAKQITRLKEAAKGVLTSNEVSQ